MTQTIYDDTSLCCISLNLIGADTISGLDEETDPAATCARLYPLVRDSLLSKHPWNFVNAKRQLGRSLDVTPENKWLYAYKLPSDLLSGPSAVFGDGSSQTTTDYEVNGDFIHCSFETVKILYRGGADPAIWPAYFIHLFVVALASMLAKPVVDNTALSDSLKLEAFGTADEGGRGGLFRDARLQDAQNKPTETLYQNSDPLTATRY